MRKIYYFTLLALCIFCLPLTAQEKQPDTNIQTGMVTKLKEVTNGKAKTVLVNLGKSHGVAVGDKIRVQYISMENGKPSPNDIGTIKVIALSGDSHSECKVPSRIGKTIKERMGAYCVLACSIVKKR